MRAKLLSAEIDIEDLEGTLNIVKASIEHSKLSVNCLHENLETLKESKIIASLEQFRMTKRQLSEATVKLSKLLYRKRQIEADLRKKEVNRDFYEQELCVLLDNRDDIRNNSDNVINMSDFRRNEDG